MAEGAEKLGRPLDQVAKYPQWLAEAGFTDIKTESFRWPTNRWPKDKKFKEIGAWALTALDGGLEGLSMAICTRGLGWSQEETLAFCAMVRKDLRDQRIHGYWKIMVTYAKKPEAYS